MNNITCNSNLEQSEGGLFVHVTPDEMYKHPDLFGGGVASSKLVCENANVSIISQQQETTMDNPEMIRPDAMNPSDKLAAIRYRFIRELSQCNLLLRHQDTLYMSNNHIYRPYNEGTFISNVFSYICSCNFELSCKDIQIIVNELKMRAYFFNGEPNDERYTYCINGYFNNVKGSMESTTPVDYFPTIQLAGSYLGVAPQVHPIMDKFLSTLFDGNDMLIQRAWEIIGYCISSDAHAKRFFVFPSSSGDNGKSTFIALICGLLIGTATIGMSMKNLLGGRFAISELQGKRINVSSDEGALTLDSAQLAVLKRISGHDRITADKKNAMQISFLSTCKIIIASNHDIGMAYSSGDSAIRRRICTLPFDVKIPKAEQNPNIVSMILNSELNEITTEALNAFIRLENSGYHFTGDDTGLDDYSIRNTPIDAQYYNIENFVMSYIRPQPGNFVLTQNLYETFNCYYNNNRDTFRDITGFSQALYKYLTANGFIVEKAKRHQGNDYEGIMIFEP